MEGLTSGSWSMMLKMGLGFGLLRNKFSVHPLAAEHARRTTKKANPEVRLLSRRHRASAHRPKFNFGLRLQLVQSLPG